MRKITIITAALLFVFVSAYAQGDGEGTDFLTKGLRYAGGSFGITVDNEKHESGGTSSDGPKTTNFNILPVAGYAFSDKFVAGLGIGFASMSTKTIDTNPSSGDEIELKNKYNQFVIKPMIGYYKRITNRLYCMPYFYFGFGFGSSTNESYDYFEDKITETKASLNSFEVGLEGSLKYFIAKEWAFTLSYGKLFYNNTTQKPKDSSSDEKWTNSSYGLDLDLSSVNIGLVYTF